MPRVVSIDRVHFAGRGRERDRLCISARQRSSAFIASVIICTGLLPLAVLLWYEPKLKSSIPNFSQNFQPNHQTLEGSFSAVSTPIFASKSSFCSVFRNLQDCHTFAPLETQNLHKFLSNFLYIFAEISAKIAIFQQFSSNFASISMKFSQNFDE